VDFVLTEVLLQQPANRSNGL